MSWRTSNHDFKYYIGLIPIWNEEKSLKRALEFLKEILHIVYNFDDFQLFPILHALNEKKIILQYLIYFNYTEDNFTELILFFKINS